LPTYLYHCDKCSEPVEFILKMDDRDSKLGLVCTSCNDGHLVRSVTPIAFGDPVRMGLSGKRGDMKEILQRVHQRTPGSILDQTSQINKI
jgi:putative FmdB family regulatory protein